MLASGEVDSIALIRTIVRPRRFSSEPILCGQIGQRRLVAQLAAQLLARGLELAPLTAHAARPGVLAERVDHRAANPPLGERLELDAARLVEAVRGIDQTDDAVLDEVADVDRMGHCGRHATGELLDERNARRSTRGLSVRWLLGAHRL